MYEPHFGMNRRDLDQAFRALGGRIISIRRTGEIRYIHWLMDERPKANARRKDAPSHMVNFVREAQRRVLAERLRLDVGAGAIPPSTTPSGGHPGGVARGNSSRKRHQRRRSRNPRARRVS